MIRFLLIIALLYFIGYFVFWFFKNKLIRFLNQMHPPQASTKPPIEGEKLVSCQICKLYVPVSKAKEKEGFYYCEEHATSAK